MATISAPHRKGHNDVHNDHRGDDDARSASNRSQVVEELDRAKEIKLLAKLDLAIIPIIMLVYLSCFLDRSNIGNVKVAGMPQDIGASPQQFSTAVSIFYVTYVTFETPAAVLLKKLTPRAVLASLCVVWSLTTVVSGFLQNVGGLYATRLILGACEAGLFPSLNLYLTMVYRREEQAKRVAYLVSCAALAGAFGGLLAYAILQMDGIGGYAGWRWVYIIEGLFSILIGILVWFGLPNDPADAYFLNKEEKEMMRVRHRQRQEYMGNEEFEWAEVRNAFTDPKLYLSGCIQFCQDILLYGFSTFLPSILQSSGYDTLQSNYLTIPVYVWGAICFYVVAFLSDKISLRGPFLLFTNFFGIAGYIILLCAATTANGVQYFATFCCAVAVYNGPGLTITWLNVNVAPHYRRATEIGFQQTMANTAGIVAGQIYQTTPYRLGHGLSLGALGLAQVLIVGNMVYLRRYSRKKERIARGEVVDDRKLKTGDRNIGFKYHL